MKEENKEAMKEYKVKPEIGYLLQGFASLKSSKAGSEMSEIHAKLNFMGKEPKTQEKAASDEKIYPRVKVYLNICTHERVLNPLDKHGNVVTDYQVHILLCER